MTEGLFKSNLFHHELSMEELANKFKETESKNQD